MSRTLSPFSTIMRKHDKGTPIPDGYKSFFLDERSKTVMEKEPGFLQNIGKKVGYYIISTSETAKCDGFTFVLDSGIALSVTYLAKCTQAHEVKALRELYHEDKAFETVLNDRLKSYLSQYFVESRRELSVSVLKNAEEKLIHRCHSETGILITPVILFQAGNHLDKFQLKSSPFSVRLQDYDDSISFEFDLEVWPLDGDISKALLKTPSPENLIVRLRELITRELWNRVSINQICLALNHTNEDFQITSGKGSVKEMLAGPVNHLLAEEGRKIGHFELHSASIENLRPEEHLEIEHVSSYKIADDDETVTVKSRVSLRLIDISAYKQAEQKYQIKKKALGISGWFKESVITPLIKDILFDQVYRDILLNPDGIKQSIETSILSRAADIGYAVKQHTHLPDIRKLKLVEGFSISLHDEEFETKASDVKIKLHITVKGKITHLENLAERLLHPTVDIESEMKAEIRSVVESEVHTMDPRRIYLWFSHAGDEYDVPVDAALARCIAKCLTNQYAVDGSSLRSTIKLSPSEDEFIRKIRELSKEIRKFSLEILAGMKDSYIEPLVFEIQYGVIGVDTLGWAKLLSRISKDVSIQFGEIEEFLRALITEKFNSIDYASLKSEDIEFKAWLKNAVREYATAEVASKFGLLIDFYSILRLRSQTERISSETAITNFIAEEEASKKRKQDEINQAHLRIQLLTEKENEAIKREELQNAANYRKQIEELKNSSQGTVPKSGDIRAQIEQSKSTGVDTIKKLFMDPKKMLASKEDNNNEEAG